MRRFYSFLLCLVILKLLFDCGCDSGGVIGPGVGRNGSFSSGSVVSSMGGVDSSVGRVLLGGEECLGSLNEVYTNGDIINWYRSCDFYVSFSNVEIWYYGSGGVSNGFLSSNHFIYAWGGLVEFSNRVIFNEDGSVLGYDLPDGGIIDIGGVDVEFSGFVTFHSNGMVRSGRLVGDHSLVVGGQLVVFNTILHFYESGGVRVGRIVDGQRLSVDEVDWVFKDILSFYDNGVIRSGRLDGDQMGCSNDYYIRFSSDSNFECGKDLDIFNF